MLRDARLEGHSVPERIFDVQTPGLGESSRDEIPLHHALDILDAAASRPDASRWAAFARAQAPARPSSVSSPSSTCRAPVIACSRESDRSGRAR
mgnify:CR=1 FL=1